jgi:hypothetical protein
MEEKNNASRILRGEAEGKYHREDLDTDVKVILNGY